MDGADKEKIYPTGRKMNDGHINKSEKVTRRKKGRNGTKHFCICAGVKEIDR